MAVPRYFDMFNPTLEALFKLGGSASVPELEDEVASILGLSDEDLEEGGPDTRSRFSYRFAWARSYLKIYGVIENSIRGVWSLTAKGREIERVDPAEVKRFVRLQQKARRAAATEEQEDEEPDSSVSSESWRDEMLGLIKEMAPEQFERLCQRLLREAGFTQVEVTGRSGDGGIDGTGRVQLGGFLGFPVIFQCKRWQGSVGPSVVRDFRGAMIGRADRGLILTTGTFSREARRESNRDGAPPIDLVDGEDLVERLKSLGLGVTIEVVEAITVDRDWFDDI